MSLLDQYRRISLFFVGWTGLLKLVIVMPLLVLLTLWGMQGQLAALGDALLGQPITIRWLFHEAPVRMAILFVGSIFMGWGYFWCERQFFLKVAGPPKPRVKRQTAQ